MNENQKNEKNQKNQEKNQKSKIKKISYVFFSSASPLANNNNIFRIYLYIMLLQLTLSNSNKVLFELQRDSIRR